jgi:beta-glucosidase
MPAHDRSDSEPQIRLPAGLLLGVSTSAFQIEGGADERGASIWDTFCQRDGTIRDGTDARTACDHYGRWREDLDLVARLGAGAYRFSTSWSRVRPGGSGPFSGAGVDFYDRVVDELLARGIAPAVCLYHWDLPQELHEMGGWANRDTAARFAEYAALLGEHLGDRVELWATLNEPFVHLSRGYILGDHAPGMTLTFDWGPVAHGLLLGHGLAVEALRSAGVRGGIGLIESVAPVRRLGDGPDDLAVAEFFDALRNDLFLATVLDGAYPQMLLDGIPSLAAAADPRDMAAIGAPLDFLGINYYQPVGVRAPAPGSAVPFEVLPVEGLPLTASGMMIDPDGLRESLVGLARRDGGVPPLYVTEIGCASDDVLDEHGRVDDPERIAYLHEHLRALLAAIEAGADVRGCFVWSLLDNFEWELGYGARYGIVHVDDDLRRTPKRSFEWLTRLAGAGAHPAARTGAG